jgi:hypothetical protein
MGMARPLRRPVRFTACLDPTEALMFLQLAEIDGEDRSHLFRSWIRRMHAARFGLNAAMRRAPKGRGRTPDQGARPLEQLDEVFTP